MVEVGGATKSVDEVMGGDVTGVFGGDFLSAKRFRLEVGAEDFGSRAGKMEGHLSTDAGGGAGDEGGATCKAERGRKRFGEFGKRHDDGLDWDETEPGYYGRGARSKTI